MPVVRNPQYYFREGFCWNNVLLPSLEESMVIKSRIKGSSVNDVASMSLYSLTNMTPNYFFVSLLGTKIIYNYLKCFINNTVNLQINDFRLFPIVIPNKKILNKLEELFKQAVQIKKRHSNGVKLDNIQQEIDILVNELYFI